MKSTTTSPQLLNRAETTPRVQHLLITQFNLNIVRLNADKRGQEVRTRKWMEERLAIFEHYCLPSILFQSEQRFTWLLLMDEATDEDVKERVNGYSALMPNIELCYLPPIKGSRDRAEAILARVDDSTDILVTTRLDNDDALHKDALACVRQRVSSRREFLNLRMGFVSDGRRARVISHKYSPFTSFVEPRTSGSFRTVYCGRHGHLRAVAPVRQIAHQPLWFRLIHERNVANVGFWESRRPTSWDLRSLHRWFRHAAVGEVRRRLWRKELRRDYELDEISGRFHIGGLSALPTHREHGDDRTAA